MRYVNSQGAEHLVNWELASTAEYRQLLSKFKQIEPYMEPPFVIETVSRLPRTATPRSVTPSWSEKPKTEKAQKKTAKAAAKKKSAEPEAVETTTRASCLST